MDDFLLAATLAAGGTTAVRLAYRHWAFGLTIVLLLFATHAFSDYLPPVFDRVVSVYPDDVVFVILFAAAIPRLVRAKFLCIAWVWWALFGVFIAASVALGLRLHGVASTGNDARTFFYLYAGVTYFGSHRFTPNRVAWLTKGWVCCAGFLLAVAVVRWVALLMGSALQGPADGQDSWLQLRVLNAAQSLFILQATLLLLVYRHRNGTGFHPQVPANSQRAHGRRLWFAAFGVTAMIAVLVLQHRSVWVVALVSIGLVLLYEARRRLKLITGILFVVSLTAAAWEFLDLRRSALGESLRESSLEVLQEDSTFVWRLNQWNMYYQQGYLSETKEWLLGRPFGSPYGSMYGAIDVSPHNWYVNVVLRTGLLGLFSVLAAVGYILRKLWPLSRTPTPLSHEARALVLLLATQTVFSTVYSPGIEQCIYMGTAFALLSSYAQARALAPEMVTDRLPRQMDTTA